LGVVVDDAVLDDSPTAELLPNSGPSKLWLVVNSEEVWLWIPSSLCQTSVVSIWIRRQPDIQQQKEPTTILKKKIIFFSSSLLTLAKNILL
jgi:hypothetical protein